MLPVSMRGLEVGDARWQPIVRLKNPRADRRSFSFREITPNNPYLLVMMGPLWWPQSSQLTRCKPILPILLLPNQELSSLTLQRLWELLFKARYPSFMLWKNMKSFFKLKLTSDTPSRNANTESSRTSQICLSRMKKFRRSPRKHLNFKLSSKT